MMGMGIFWIMYVMLFTGGKATKFQNKGKLSTYLKSSFKKIYFKTSSSIETFAAADIRPHEFFSILLPNGVPTALDMETNQASGEKSKQATLKIFDRLEKKLLDSSVDATIISWSQKPQNVFFEHETKYIDLDQLKENEKCFYVNNHVLNEPDFNVFRGYLYDRMSYLSNLPLLDHKIKVLGMCTFLIFT